MMSTAGSSSSLFVGTHSLSSRVRISRSWPTPEQWTKVKELNVENREPCEIWRSGVHQQLANMKQHMNTCGQVINCLEMTLDRDRAKVQSQAAHVDINIHTHSSTTTQTD